MAKRTVSVGLDAIVITTAVPENVRADMGEIIILWANLEWRISLLIYQLLEIDETVGREVIRTPRLTDRIDMLKTLISKRKVACPVDLNAFRKELVKLADRRDWLGHGIWYQAAKDRWTVRASKGELKLPGPPPRKISLRKDPQGVLINHRWCQSTADRIHRLIGQCEEIDREIAATS